MTFIAPGSLIEAMRWRYAVKVFDPSRSIPADTWTALEEVLVLSPSSYGLQPWKFIVITDLTLRQMLKPYSWNQAQITDCSHLVVFLRQVSVNEQDLQRLLDRKASLRGTPTDPGSNYGALDVMRRNLIDGRRGASISTWAANQVYIALGNFLTSAAVLGIDTCPIEGFNPADCHRILGLEDHRYEVVVMCACGYRSANDPYAQLAKVRFSASEMIEHR